MKIAIIYFSPTYNTSQIAQEVSKTLNNSKVDVEMIDITPFSKRQEPINFDEQDALIFGFPIYVQRIPIIIREWIQTLDGKGKRCSAFFTYGGVTSGIAHHDIKQRLEKQNFVLVSTGEFVAKHTFNIGGWNLMADRPNNEDLLVATEYASKTLEKLQDSEIQELFFEEPKISEKQLDRLDKVPKGGVNPPSRKGKECSMCMKCETECPNNAMNATTGNADGNRCIRCLRCMSICPDKVLLTNDLTPAYKVIVGPAHSPESLAKKKSQYFC